MGNNAVGGVDSVRTKPAWYYDTAKYAEPSLSKAILQLLDTLIPYFLLWAVMLYLVKAGYPYWVTLMLAVVAGLFLVRVFILFHDCCHHSFFASRKANKIVGTVCGILTCTPYADWQWAHAKHHATAADLDNRSCGGVWTMTADEYRSSGLWTRIKYRVYRNPLVMLVPGPLIMFLGVFRFPTKGAGKRQQNSVLVTNVAILVLLVIGSRTLGLRDIFRIALPVVFVATAIGVWLFYVQHQFEGVGWFRHEQWDVITASLKGCSYYRLPAVLRWFTGNIGIHHVHHIRTGIPNYNLQRCFDETPQLQDIHVLTMRESLRSLWLNLWDEERQQLVGFRAIGR